jgi:hypothetical protein
MEEILEAVFSLWSLSGLHNEDTSIVGSEEPRIAVLASATSNLAVSL